MSPGIHRRPPAAFLLPLPEYPLRHRPLESCSPVNEEIFNYTTTPTSELHFNATVFVVSVELSVNQDFHLLHEFDGYFSTGLCQDSFLVDNVFLFLQLNLLGWHVGSIALHVTRSYFSVHSQHSILNILCTSLITTKIMFNTELVQIILKPMQ